MKKITVSEKEINGFRRRLSEEEKSSSTVEKYTRDISSFVSWLEGAPVTKDSVIGYKQHLIDSGYAVRSINSMLAGINSFLNYLGMADLRVRALKVQNEVFCPEEKELTRNEYERLCRTAAKRKNERLYLILQTICSTGIRVSELSFITVDAVIRGKATVSLKGKIRTVLLPGDLRKKLMRYITKSELESGSIFVTKNGKPLGRSSIWREMKSLCGDAGVEPGKVYPHNLRHLFARVFYSIEKDIVKLADVLGHSSINTTRIYIISTGTEHLRCMERLKCKLQDVHVKKLSNNNVQLLYHVLLAGVVILQTV